jgi:SAM-dependent methyltransferase
LLGWNSRVDRSLFGNFAVNRKERRAAHKTRGPGATHDAKVPDILALAIRHQEAGQVAEAQALFTRAITLDPKSAEAHHGLARVLMERDELDDAMVRLRRALELRPDDTAIRMTMVVLLRQQGKSAAAAAAYEGALAADPRSGEWRKQLLDELSAPWARPIDLARVGIAFIRLNPAIRACTERVTRAWPKRPAANDLFGQAGIAAIAADRVLRFLLESCPVFNIELEKFLTCLRAAMLTMAQDSGTPDQEVIALHCALANQCFLNDYVFSADEDETRAADRLRIRLVEAMAAREAFPMAWLPAVASYLPLYTLPDAERLLGMSWPSAVGTLIARQVAEPHEEQRYRLAMPVLTRIDDATSLKVRQQYEEHPFPCWIKPAPAGPPTTPDAYVRERFPHARHRDLGRGGDKDILIAGCGTGQQSIEVAQRFGGARVLAIDLSLASLAYAQRQSRACGLAAIEYAQADIMSLSSIGRSFDLIECSGVLHHLADPLEGWRRLLAMLRPDGIMRLGFYSELARQDIVAARRYIAERGYGDSADAIRACRQDFIECADGTPMKNVTAFPDFFNTSECRDLLFHVMEHRLTLPAIKSFLSENRLEFLGFDLDALILRRYGHRFPGDRTMTDLDNWHRFEQRHPTTFAAMYQFWVQRRD